MPLSPADRIAAQGMVLKWLLIELGDRNFHAMPPVELDQEMRRDVPPTTWKDLEDMGEIVVCWFHDQIEGVHFTPKGWFDSITLTGKLDEVAFQESFGTLTAALKKRVDRANDAQVEVWRIVGETGLSEEFIANCINANIWRRKYARYGAEFLPDSQDFIGIPSRFCMPICDRVPLA